MEEGKEFEIGLYASFNTLPAEACAVFMVYG